MWDLYSKVFFSTTKKYVRETKFKLVHLILWGVVSWRDQNVTPLLQGFFQPQKNSKRNKIETCSPYSLGGCEFKGSKCDTLTPRIFSTPQKIVRETKFKPAHLILWVVRVEGVKMWNPYSKVFSSPQNLIVSKRHLKPVPFFFGGLWVDRIKM